MADPVGRTRSTLSGPFGQHRKAPATCPSNKGTHRIFTTAFQRQSQTFCLPTRSSGMMGDALLVLAFDRRTMWKRIENDQPMCNDSVWISRPLLGVLHLERCIYWPSLILIGSCLYVRNWQLARASSDRHIGTVLNSLSLLNGPANRG